METGDNVVYHVVVRKLFTNNTIMKYGKYTLSLAAIGILVSIPISIFLSPNQEQKQIKVFEKDSIQQGIVLDIRGTVYPPTSKQKKKYLITASGREVLNNDSILPERIISLSQDLMFNYNLLFGDSVEVLLEHAILNGKWIIEDCMDSTMINACDFLIARKDLPKFRQGVYNVKLKINK